MSTRSKLSEMTNSVLDIKPITVPSRLVDKWIGGKIEARWRYRNYYGVVPQH